MAVVVLDTRIVLDYLLGQPGGVCALASITCYTWMDTFMEGETPLHKITEQASWLKRLTPSMGSLVEYCGPCLNCILSIGDNPAYNNQSNPHGGLYFLRSFKFIFTAADHQQMISLRLEGQKWNEV